MRASGYRSLAVSAGLAAVYLGLTFWMRAHGLGPWASWGSTAFCGFGIVAVLAAAETDRCRSGSPS